MRIFNGDCLNVMDELIEGKIIVDAIIADIPYGTSSCRWDSVIPFDEMWKRLNKIIKPSGAIVLFGNEPFSSLLRISNIKNYKYDWIWDKKSTNGFLNAKKRPLKRIEKIHVFCNKTPPYYPIMEERGNPRNKGSYNKRNGDGDGVYGKFENIKSFNNLYYPTDILEFSNASKKDKVHPTQKPVKLMEYLIKTYTKEHEIVLDFTMGSGTTGEACVNTNRDFIGIEKESEWFEHSKRRLGL